MSPLNFTHILTQTVDELSESESYKGLFHQHKDGEPLPSPRVLCDVIELARSILFPGYYGNSTVNSRTINYHIGVNVEKLFNLLTEQILAGLCFGNGDRCDECTEAKREEAARLPGKRVERLFRGEVRLVSRYACPIEGRKVGRVMTRGTFHQCQCTSHVILHPSEFIPVFRPCDDVAMTAHGLQSVGMCLVQVFVQPLLVDLVAAAVPGKRLHVFGHLLKTGEVLAAVVYEYPLVVDMVAGQHHAHGGGIAKAAVRSVCREAFVPPVCLDFTRKVVKVGKCMQAEPLVTDTHPPGLEADVL